MAKEPKKNEEDGIELDLSKDQAKEPEIQVVEAEKEPEIAAKREIPAEEGIAELKRQLDNERKARAEAEHRANEAVSQVNAAKSEVEDTNLQLVNNAIATVTQNKKILRSQYSAAMSVGDYEKAAEIQDAMADNSAKLLQLENGKAAMESRPKEAPQRPRAADPVEALASQLTPRSAAWVRAHPEYATDPRLNAKMIAAHNLAIADGLVADTDEYFSEVENTLKISRKAPQRSDDDDPMQAAAQVTQRRYAPPEAPVSRSGSAPDKRPNVVRLTAQEREIASMMGMTEVEYATNKLALKKEGKLN